MSLKATSCRFYCFASSLIICDGAIETYDGAIETYDGAIETYDGAIETYDGAIETYDGAIETYALASLLLAALRSGYSIVSLTWRRLEYSRPWMC